MQNNLVYSERSKVYECAHLAGQDGNPEEIETGSSANDPRKEGL
jgi:hypothetical protein